MPVTRTVGSHLTRVKKYRPLSATGRRAYFVRHVITAGSEGNPMRALQLTEPGRLEIRDVPIPEPGPGELLIQVGASGICHSDLHVLHLPFKVRDEPLILGHEIAGTIAALGDRVEGYTTGERGIV